MATHPSTPHIFCSYTVYEMGESLTVGGGDQQTADDTRAATLQLKQVNVCVYVCVCVRVCVCMCVCSSSR
jgi:hypothetical protein